MHYIYTKASRYYPMVTIMRYLKGTSIVLTIVALALLLESQPMVNYKRYLKKPKKNPKLG